MHSKLRTTLSANLTFTENSLGTLGWSVRPALTITVTRQQCTIKAAFSSGQLC